jgi:anti-sigma factor RsiW
MNCHDFERILDAYVDDELGAAEAAAVADHIEGCATCRRRLASRESLGRLVRSLPYHAAPTNLRMAVVSTPKRSRVTPGALAAAAVVVIAATLGGAASFRARQTAQATAAVAENVVNQHVSALMRARLFDVRSSNEHTVKPWYQGKLDFSPPVADLTSAGFPLIGGRVDAVDGRPAAALVYQRREHVINVFVLPTVGRAAIVDARSIRGFQERHWTQKDLSLWAVSDLNDRELYDFVRAFASATQ